MPDEPGWLGRAQWMAPILPEQSPETARRVRVGIPIVFSVNVLPWIAAIIVAHVSSSIGEGFVVLVAGILADNLLLVAFIRIFEPSWVRPAHGGPPPAVERSAASTARSDR